MIAVPAGMQVLVATKPVDFRKGADGLAALVREALGRDPFSGMIFVFRGARACRPRTVSVELESRERVHFPAGFLVLVLRLLEIVRIRVAPNLVL